MKDSQGNKIRAKTMTKGQAELVLERMADRTNKKIYRSALEFAIEAISGRKARAAKA